MYQHQQHTVGLKQCQELSGGEHIHASHVLFTRPTLSRLNKINFVCCPNSNEKFHRISDKHDAIGSDVRIPLDSILCNLIISVCTLHCSRFLPSVQTQAKCILLSSLAHIGPEKVWSQIRSSHPLREKRSPRHPQV